jgi:UDP-N-acetylmuramyl pentapeptide synthase
VLPNDVKGDVMQLVLPATSVFGKEENGKWPFREYVKMLANHNISAGRVVTKMQFDTKSPVPRVLFSPVSGINADDLDTLTAQSKTPAAENAIKLTVYQQDEGNKDAPVEVAAPVAPKVRESKKTAAAPAGDVADVIKEWTKK